MRMLCSRSASLITRTRGSLAIATTILRIVSALAASPSLTLSSLVTPSTSRATSPPKSARICVEGVVGVLDRVVQQRGDQGGGVHAQVGQDGRHRERVGDVRVAGLAVLPRVPPRGRVEGALQQPGVGLGVAGPVGRDQRLEHLADLRGLPGRVEPGQPGPDPPTGGRAGQPEAAGAGRRVVAGAGSGVTGTATPSDGRTRRPPPSADPSARRTSSATGAPDVGPAAGRTGRRSVRHRAVSLACRVHRALRRRGDIVGHRPPHTLAGRPSPAEPIGRSRYPPARRTAVPPASAKGNPTRTARSPCRSARTVRRPGRSRAAAQTVSRAWTGRGASRSPAAEEAQLQQHGEAGDRAAGPLDQVQRRLGGAAGGQHVVDHQHPVPGGERVLVHLEGRLAVLQRVGGRVGRPGAACRPCAPAPRRPRSRTRRPRRSRTRAPRCRPPRRTTSRPWYATIPSITSRNDVAVGEQRHQVLEHDAGLAGSPARPAPGWPPAGPPPGRCPRAHRCCGSPSRRSAPFDARRRPARCSHSMPDAVASSARRWSWSAALGAAGPVAAARAAATGAGRPLARRPGAHLRGGAGHAAGVASGSTGLGRPRPAARGRRARRPRPRPAATAPGGPAPAWCAPGSAARSP